MRDLDLLRLERRVGLMLAPLVATPGAAVGVVRDGALLLHRAAGLASIELNVPVGVGTTFRIASVSKQFTCAAILLLARDGLLSPGDPVRRHLPELPESLASITLDHLMRNCSGLRDMLELLRLGGTDLSTPVSEAELDAAIARQTTLNFAPGSRFLYSNSGFRLLGRVVERVSGQSLATFLESRIFQPLGMTRTRHTPDLALPVPGLATGYLPHASCGFQRAAHGFALGGEGGLVSGIEDLALWAHGLSGGALGGLETTLTATTNFTNGVVNDYALGLQVEPWRGLRVVSHGGLWPGYKTAFLRVPEKGLTVIVIANNAKLDPHHMALQVLEAALDGDSDLLPAPVPVDHSAMTGTWLCEKDGLSLDIAEDGTARMHGVPFALIPTADGRMTARRGGFPFVASLPRGDMMEVEFDAGHRCAFRRVAPVALPKKLDGIWHCAELAAEWRIADGTVHASGPIRRAGPWKITALSPRHLRIAMPSTLFEGWADAVLAKDGKSLVVNASRARGLVLTRG